MQNCLGEVRSATDNLFDAGGKQGIRRLTGSVASPLGGVQQGVVEQHRLGGTPTVRKSRKPRRNTDHDPVGNRRGERVGGSLGELSALKVMFDGVLRRASGAAAGNNAPKDAGGEAVLEPSLGGPRVANGPKGRDPQKVPEAAKAKELQKGSGLGGSGAREPAAEFANKGLHRGRLSSIGARGVCTGRFA